MVVQEMHPKENGKSSDTAMEEEEEDVDEGEEYEDMTEEEFNAINTQLDALNSALDNIEQKNDDIHAQLLQLLEANKAVRKQIREQANAEPKNEANS